MIPICSQFSSYFYRILKTNIIVGECINVAVLFVKPSNIKLWFCLQKTALKKPTILPLRAVASSKNVCKRSHWFQDYWDKEGAFQLRMFWFLFVTSFLWSRVAGLTVWEGGGEEVCRPSVTLQTIQDRLPSQWITALVLDILLKMSSYIFQNFIKRKFGQTSLEFCRCA